MQAHNPTVALSTQTVTFTDKSAIKRLGLIALSTDLTTERDFAQIFSHDLAAIHTTRVEYANPTTPENLMAMAPRISAAADLLIPDEKLEVICYSCTAASVVIGDASIAQAIHVTRPGIPVVTPSGAALMAFKALGVSRIAVLTPYLIETSKPFADYFEQHGLVVTRLECLGLEDDRMMARVSDDTIIEAALKVDTDKAEAIFLSCTGLPAVNVIDEVELRTGKPVVTSNQASAWLMHHYAGLQTSYTRCGQLFDAGSSSLATHV